MLVPAGVAMAQGTGTVSGTIIDSNGDPLPGASVRLIDTQQGASSNVDGVYTIAAVLPGTYTVAATFVGFDEATQEVTVTAGGTATADFTLADGVQLEGVTVDALGFAVNTDQLGSAQSSVAGDALTRSGETNVLRALSAKTPGVNITASGGDPGASTNIIIRGQSTIQGSNQPLIVVDGVPISNSTIDSGTAGVQQQSRLNDINPEDIASVEVLRSSAAAALWGSRAQSGVIVITTKSGRGVNNRPNVSFRSTLSFDELNQTVPLQQVYGGGNNGVYEFIPGGGRSWGDRIADRPSGENIRITGPGQYFSDPRLRPRDDLYLGAARGLQTGEEYYAIPSGRAYDASGNQLPAYGGIRSQETFDHATNLFDTGVYADNTVSVSGGDENGRYYLSAGNLTQDGIIVANSNYQRTTLRLNADRAVSSKFRVEGNANYIRSNSDRIQQGSNLSGLFLGGLRTRADFDNTDYLVDYYPDGFEGAPVEARHRSYRNPLGSNASPVYDNPFFVINRNANTSLLNRFQGKVGAIYDPTTWLNLTSRVGADYYTDRRSIYFPIFSAANTSGFQEEDNYTEFQVNVDLIARASRDLTDDIGGSLLLGANANHREFDGLFGFLTGFSNPEEFRSLQNGTAASIDADLDQSTQRTLGFFGEVEFDLYDQLFLKGTGRFDNASTFGPQAEDTFFYPSASLAWQFTELLGENPYLSFGKLRANVGVVGREPLPYTSSNRFFPQTVSDGYTSGFPLTGAGYGGGFARSSVAGNALVVPERKTEFEVGTDLRFFRDLFTFGATYYDNTSDDVIFNVDVAPSTGFTSTALNAAEISNRGIELTLDALWPRVGDFSWNTFANFTTNENTVNDLAGVQEFSLSGFTGSTSSLVEGQPFGVFYGGRWRRAASGCNPDDTDATLVTSCEPLNDRERGLGFSVSPTDNRVLNANGFPVGSGTSGVVGDPNPDWQASIGNTLRFRDLSLNALFDFSIGGQVWNGTRGALYFFGRHQDQDWYNTVSADQANSLVDFRGCTLVQHSNNSCVVGSTNTNISDATVTQNDDGTYSFRGYVENFGAGDVIVNQQYFTSGPGSGFTGPFEQFIEDGSFARLRELSLSYNLKTGFVQRVGLSSIDLTLTGRNLWLATDYSGIDPETNLTGTSNGRGLDYFNNPSTRSYQVSLRFNY